MTSLTPVLSPRNISCMVSKPTAETEQRMEEGIFTAINLKEFLEKGEVELVIKGRLGLDGFISRLKEFVWGWSETSLCKRKLISAFPFPLSICWVNPQPHPVPPSSHPHFANKIHLYNKHMLTESQVFQTHWETANWNLEPFQTLFKSPSFSLPGSSTRLESRSM